MMRWIPASMAVAMMTTGGAWAQTSSLLAQPSSPPGAIDYEDDPAASLHAVSLFTVPPPRPPVYAVHDLVEIIIRESSSVRRQQSVETEKEYETKAEVAEFPQLTINDFLEGVLKASANANPPKLDISAEREFTGEGEYRRIDDVSARVTAEVVSVLPNGNLVLEARTEIETDGESSRLVLSGTCDPKSISPAGTILSTQLYNLRVVKHHEGELRKTSEKGLFGRILDTLFAF